MEIKKNKAKAEPRNRLSLPPGVSKSNGFIENKRSFWGFLIKDKVTQESIFVHINNCVDEIIENNMVTFETERGPKGLTAVKVKKA